MRNSYSTDQTTFQIEKATTTLNHLWLEITEKCNLSCVHCYTESNSHLPLSYGMKADDWINVLTSARAMGCENIQFIGGEPTIHPDLDYLLEQAYLLGFGFIEVFTNGTAISSEKINRYKLWNIHIAISFYSTDFRKHDLITKRKGSFLKTLDFIKRAVESGLDLRVGLTQLDQSDLEIEEALLYLKDLGITNIKTDKVRKIGRGRSLENNLVAINPLTQLCGQCHKGRICVTSSGEVFPCIMARTEFIGNVLSQELTDIVNGAPREDFVHRQIAYLREIRNLHQYDQESPCNPNLGGTCHPQMGNCGPTTKLFESAKEFELTAPCNPNLGGTCHPQMGNCGPSDK